MTRSLPTPHLHIGPDVGGLRGMLVDLGLMQAITLVISPRSWVNSKTNSA